MNIIQEKIVFVNPFSLFSQLCKVNFHFLLFIVDISSRICKYLQNPQQHRFDLYLSTDAGCIFSCALFFSVFIHIFSLIHFTRIPESVIMVPVMGQRMFPSEIYLPLQGLFQSNRAGWKIYFLFWLLFHDLYNMSVQTADGSGH